MRTPTLGHVAGNYNNGGVHQVYLESVGPAASAGLLELATLGAHVRLDGVVGVQVVDAENGVSKTARGSQAKYNREGITGGGIMSCRRSARMLRIDETGTYLHVYKTVAHAFVNLFEGGGHPALLLRHYHNCAGH